MHTSASSKIYPSTVVSRQVPEFIREDYPTFVAFVEAYYEYLKQNDVDLTQLRDIDKSLESFIEHFKKELAYNIPITVTDERLLLSRIKDHYLAKGSEGSYKFLFRLLFGKDVQVMYPGQQMLRASDGKWNQENSVFIQVDYGDPDDVVGKLVDIESGERILRVLVDRKETLIGEVERIIALGGNIFEMFLDKRFFGEVKKGDRIVYKDSFQATILPATTYITIAQPGKNFRVGQVFEIRSGGGTGALMKITEISPTGGVLKAEVIKFGIGYTADFEVSLLSTNNIGGQSAKTRSEISGTANRTGDEIFINDRPNGLSEQGYINLGDYVSSDFIDGTYSGSLLREFTLDANNAQTNSDDPCIIKVRLGALNRYPGFYETNNGFLSDSIFIQDSRYYQAFSYVLRIDERLNKYSSAVKTMVHPAGMKLFGEYDIVNEVDLSFTLDSLVKSLGIGIEDVIDPPLDESSWYLTKNFDDSILPQETYFLVAFIKTLQDEFDAPTDTAYLSVGKRLTDSISTPTDSFILAPVKFLSDSIDTLDFTDSISFGFILSMQDSITQSETLSHITTKYLEDTSVGTLSNTAEVWVNSYQGQDYYAEDYSVGLSATTTS